MILCSEDGVKCSGGRERVKVIIYLITDCQMRWVGGKGLKSDIDEGV